MRPLNLVTVTAGLSVPSSTRLLADRLTGSATRQLTARQLAFRDEVVELREHATAVAEHLVTGFPGPALGEALAAVAAADGLIVVTPVFAASYSGLFKSFFDVLEPDSLRATPVLIAATGGTPRHSLVLEHALRPLFAYLGAIVVPTAVYAATSDWGAAGEAGSEELARRFDRAGRELVDLMGTHGAAERPADPYEEPVPFEQQLAAVRGGS
ncbi:CE1759 family FMN reductase [Streptacidiphilus fuscans]|uniref:NAD(P)H-dependent oxidoreductase n=1 Tax=Streptacidiphilus fuscans TaxID=2789292 RepID=A0A931AXN8_9ACTN|nr:CE1759 family FMN reductase [Streptacidiphilus fuscans]MBF9066463.1 NAD(P)H-dependent oxidoreductase [Streptacidiphilus fuscans]